VSIRGILTFPTLLLAAKGDTMNGTNPRDFDRCIMAARPPLRRSATVVLVWALCAMGVAHAQADAAKAADDCESAVTDAVKRMRGREATDVQFVKTKRTLTPSTDDETSLKGEGRYRGASGRAMPFGYSCALNTKTGATSGVVFRDLAVFEDKPWNPDLTNVSVIDCEGAAVAALKSKNPRAGRIVLDSESRQLRPAGDEHIALEGRGAVERAPGMNSAPFTYRCEVEPRSGRIISVQTSI
jgi:hypothetical protein